MLRNSLIILMILLLWMPSCSEPEQTQTICCKIQKEVVVSVSWKGPFLQYKFRQEKQWIDTTVEKLWNEKAINGVLLVAEKEGVIFKKSYGRARYNSKEEIKVDDKFQLASVSKIITATAVLQLCETGKLKLDDRVKKFIPELPYDKITIRHLLQHTSGLPNYIYLSENYWNKQDRLSMRDVALLFGNLGLSLDFPPGYRHKYCNTNYVLLAFIIERISGMSYAAYLEKNIFVPSGMKNTLVVSLRDTAKLKVHGHMPLGRGYVEKPLDYLDDVAGDKGIYTTAEDMFLFDRSLFAGKLISKQMMNLAFTTFENPTRFRKCNYGLGFRVREKKNGQKVIYHFGWWKGFKTYYMHDMETGKCVVSLNNRKNIKLGGLVYDLLIWPKLEREKKEADDDSNNDKEGSP